MRLKRWFATPFLLLALTALVAACSPGPAPVSLEGVVLEQGSDEPLADVRVSFPGSPDVVLTGSDGKFNLERVRVPADVTFELPGYTTVRVEAKNTDPITVRMAPLGGAADATGATLANLEALDGSSVDAYKVRLAGNVNDFTTEAGAAGQLRSLTTALTVSRLQALVNGTVYPVEFGPDGSFSQDVPVDGGSNTIRLRVFDDNGAAYNTAPITVTVTLASLDLRVVLRWDQGGGTDVDVHMFKESAGHTVPRAYNSWDGRGLPRVGWDQKDPEDFGASTAENPFLDIDDTRGFGPETIVLQEMTPGNYHVWVHLYNLPSSVEQTKATVDITVKGVTRTFTKTLTDDWETWYVTSISAPSGDFVRIEPSAGR